MVRMLALFAVLLAWEPVHVSAQDASAVVLEFSGRGRARVRNEVVRAVEGSVRLTPVASAESMAQSEGLDLGSAIGIRRVAEALNLDLVITGRVRGRGRRARMSLKIYDRLGAEIASAQSTARPGARGRREIAEATQNAVTTALASLPAPEPEPEPEPEENWYDTGDEPVQEEEEEASEAGGLPRLRALIGVQARDRFAEVTFAPGGGSSGYSAPFHSELSLRIESFFLGNRDGAARGLYAQLDFAHSLGISTEDQDGTEFDTSAWRFIIQGGYLYPVANDFVRVGALVGFGIDRFSIGENPILPSSQYPFLRAGLAASFAIVDSYVRARLDFGYRAVFGAGDLEDEFGADSSVWAIDIAAEVGGIYKSFTYAFRAGVVRYDLSFDGEATSPAAITAASIDGKDRSYFLELQVGYAFE
ncbi:MAG: hypothetical protein AAF938_17260 [Myxococcota bacterium]